MSHGIADHCQRVMGCFMNCGLLSGVVAYSFVGFGI